MLAEQQQNKQLEEVQLALEKHIGEELEALTQVVNKRYGSAGFNYRLVKVPTAQKA